MLVRYPGLKEHVYLLDSADVDPLSLNMEEDRCINAQFVHLKNLERITKCLQKDSTTMEKVRVLFDCVMIDFPESANRLSTNAAIVGSSVFEPATVKVQRGNATNLTHEECLAIRNFALSWDESVENSAELPYRERALRR